MLGRATPALPVARKLYRKPTSNTSVVFTAVCTIHILDLCCMTAGRPRQSTPPWSDLQPELLGLVLSRLPSLTDRIRLREVCHQWCRAARMAPLLPTRGWPSTTRPSSASRPVRPTACLYRTTALAVLAAMAPWADGSSSRTKSTARARSWTQSPGPLQCGFLGCPPLLPWEHIPRGRSSSWRCPRPGACLRIPFSLC